MKLQRSPLFHKYIESEAKLVNFAGWEMPISFTSLIEEHKMVRESAGFFDISHMGVISVKGINPKEHIQKFFPTNLYSICKGQSCYSLLLNKRGGIIDDLIIYDLGIQESNIRELLLIVNASRFKIDFDWLKSNADNEAINISNAKKDNALIALQGQESFKLFEAWSSNSLSHLSKFGCEYQSVQKNSKEENIFVSKTGYTGENGLEILLSPNLAISLWDFLLSKKVYPCGLGARDTLRLESGLHLYGQDLNEDISPYEAGLGWVVNLENNHEFYGRNHLEKIATNGIKRKLVGITIQGRAIARNGCPIIDNDKIIGEITSGSWSPSLEKPIALAYLDLEYCSLNKEVDVIIRDKRFNGIVSKKTFYTKSF